MSTTTSEIRIRRSIASVAFTLLLFVSPALMASSATDLLVVFDKSGSMNDDGKLGQAQSSLKDALAELPAKSHVGLEVFSGCSDSNVETLMPIGPLDRSAMTSQVDAIKAGGKTALDKALRQAASTLGSSDGKKAILLLSDGEETCDGSPCEAIKSIVDNGIDVVAYVVGFQVDSSAEKQLRCIADSTGGKYFPAENHNELNTAMKTVMREATAAQVFGDCLPWLRPSTPSETVSTTGRCVRLSINGASGIKMGSASRITIYPTTDCSGSNALDVTSDTSFCDADYPDGSSLNDNARSIFIH